MIKENYLNIICIALLLCVPFFGFILDEPYYLTLATKVVILAIAGAGLNLVLGYGGFVSFGHAAFFGIGGYVSGILASHALNYYPIIEWPFIIEGTTQMLIILPLAMLISGGFALLIGMLCLRTSGVYFIMITLAFAQMVYYFAISWPAYGGEDGLSVYLRNNFPGLNTMNGLSFFSICFVLLIIVLFFSSRIVNSNFGLALQSAKQNPERVAAVGIEPIKVQLIAFVISGAITGLAGALYTDLNRFVSPCIKLANIWRDNGFCNPDRKSVV